MRYKYPLSLQTVLPKEYEADTAFCDLLSLLRDLSFTGLELNVARPEAEDPDRISAFLSSRALRCTMFATGLTAKGEGLSLSHPEDETRTRSIRRTKDLIDFSSDLGAGLIIGYLKGSASADKGRAENSFKRSLDEIIPHAEKRRVHTLIEATNRYESSVANSLAEAVALISAYSSSFLHILPDTFHMNIEESSPLEALKRFLPHILSIHLSDNNRFFPGFGAIDFRELFALLARIGFSGGIAVEGNVRDDIVSDIVASAAYLSSCAENV
jgi:D-psicose/D-tagatose/L-ribulose 3-epimerase